MGYAAKLGGASNSIPDIQFTINAYASCAAATQPYALLQFTNINTAFAYVWKYFKYVFTAQGSSCRIYAHQLYKSPSVYENGQNNKEYLCSEYTKTYMQTVSTMSGSWPNTSSNLLINFYN